MYQLASEFSPVQQYSRVSIRGDTSMGMNVQYMDVSMFFLYLYASHVRRVKHIDAYRYMRVQDLNTPLTVDGVDSGHRSCKFPNRCTMDEMLSAPVVIWGPFCTDLSGCIGINANSDLIKGLVCRP